MSAELTQQVNGKAAISAYEMALVSNDLSKLTADERQGYYQATCNSLGLNQLTQPFQYINLSGKLTLYATRACTDQLRKINGVSLTVVARERIGDLYSVSVRAEDKTGRVDESTGVVTLTGLKGDGLANALMKAETKAKRRATLSICGLGFLDETEIETIPGAQRLVESAPALPDAVANVFPESTIEPANTRPLSAPTNPSIKPPSEKQRAMFAKLMAQVNIPEDRWPLVVKQLSGWPDMNGKNVSAVISAFADNGWKCPDSIKALSVEEDGPMNFEDDEIPF